MSDELRFSSEEEAFQYLSDFTGKKIKIANKNKIENLNIKTGSDLTIYDVASEISKVMNGEIEEIDSGASMSSAIYSVKFKGTKGPAVIEVDDYGVTLEEGDLTGEEKMAIKGIVRRSSLGNVDILID